MSFDFGSLSGRASAESLTTPRDVFNALPGKKEDLGYLRDGQGRVLERWAERRDESDLVIKINTGGGKTVVGLSLIHI